MDPEEKELLTVRPAWKSYFVFYAAIIIFGLGPRLNPEAGLNPGLGAIISLLLIFFVIFRKKTTRYRVTSLRIVRETGGLGLALSKDLPLEEIASMAVRRGIAHRFLGIGHIQFRAKSPNQFDLWWFGIPNPFQVVKDIQRLISKI